MLTKVTIKNFRQHEDLEVNFTDGVTVVRGANESGKSTIFEAISYALFGIKACRDNDVSTWGKPANSQRVEVEFVSEGKHYTVWRTAKAAELNGEGLKVAGQSDVTRKCEQLIDLKPGMGEKLMFVPQNKMRGVLEEGGAKTTTMIEQLAEMDVIEQWIDNLQENYPTGNTKILETELGFAQGKFDDANERLKCMTHPEKAMAELVETDKQNVERVKNSITEMEDEIAKQVNKVDKAVAKAQKVEAAHDAWEDYDRLNHSLTKRKADIVKFLESISSNKPDASVLEGLEISLNRLKSHQIEYEEWLSLRDYVPVVTNMSFVQIDEECKQAEERYDEQKDLLARLTAKLEQLRGGFIEGNTCLVCGSVLQSEEEVQAHNSKLQDEIQQVENEYLDVKARISFSEPVLKKLREWRSLKQPEFNADYWEVVNDQHPVILKWKGERPEDCSAEIRETERQIRELQSQIDAYEATQRKAEDQRNQLDAVNVELAQLVQVPEVTWPEVKTALQKAEEASKALKELELELEDKRLNLQFLESVVENPRSQYQYLFDEYEVIEKEVMAASSEVERYKNAIKDTELNTSLLKFLRKVKPQVANKVWQTVCQTVSHYFSLMRGQQSTVSKEDSGFVVDGHNVSSLSGSTLDILGIAIRVALTKTFMPTCRFLLLDEPFAACSKERQEQALGFITSCGFEQVIIVTHEDSTQAVADSLVSI